MSRLGFLTARVWLDADGQHLWLAHDCVDGRTTTMLPTQWREGPDGYVAPSIACRACGLHYTGRIDSIDSVSWDDRLRGVS